MPDLAGTLGSMIGKLPEQPVDRIRLALHFGAPEDERIPPQPFVQL
jgi:hypothetical protein